MRFATLGSIGICVYVDHNPPHFHARHPDGDAQIDLRNLSVLRGRISAKGLQEVRDWAADHTAELWAAWSELNEQDETTMSDDMIEVGAPLHDLRRLAVARDGSFRLTLEWDDGFGATVDLAGAIARRKALGPLRDPALFRAAEIVDDGAAVGWPDGPEIAAELLRRIAVAQRPMDSVEFRAIQAANSITNAAASAIIGRGLRTVERYRAGRTIPQPVAIAMRALRDDPSLVDAWYVPPGRAGRPAAQEA